MTMDHEDVAERVEQLGREWFRTERALLVAKFLIPLGLAVVFLATLPLVFPDKWGTMWITVVAYMVPPAGKESVIPFAISQGVAPWLAAVYISLVDIIVGLFLVWNWDLALRIPWVGGYIRSAIEQGSEVLERREWIENLAFVGLVLFVMVPFQGSGAVGASVLGRMIGMPPYRVWFSIVIGAILGTSLIAFLGFSVVYAFQQALGTGIAVLLGVLLVLALGGYLWWRDYQKEEDGGKGEARGGR